MLLILAKLAMTGLPDTNEAVPIIFGTLLLAVAGNGCWCFPRSSGLLLEHSFLVPVQIPLPLAEILQCTSADFLVSFNGLCTFPVQIFYTNFHEIFPWTLGLCMDS